MNGDSLTPEVESLIQGYVEGDLTASECGRLRQLLEAAPELVAPILTSLRMDTLLRQQSVLQTATADWEASPGQLRPRRASWTKARFAMSLTAAACMIVVVLLGAKFFSSRESKQSAAPLRPSIETGAILYEHWAGIPGVAINDLTSHPSFPSDPTRRQLLSNFEAPSNQGDGYGARMRGYLRVPVSGDYVFWIASDDAGELWLSEDENPATKRRICFVEFWAPPREWTWKPTQQSQPIRLEAGRRYYIEALHKQGQAGDSLAVAWQPPNGQREIIPGSALSPLIKP